MRPLLSILLMIFLDFTGNVAKFVRVGKHISVLIEGVFKVAYTIFNGLDVL